MRLTNAQMLNSSFQSFPIVPAATASKEVKQQYFRDGVAWIIGHPNYGGKPSSDLIKSAQYMFHYYEDRSWAAAVKELKADVRFQNDLVSPRCRILFPIFNLLCTQRRAAIRCHTFWQAWQPKSDPMREPEHQQFFPQQHLETVASHLTTIHKYFQDATGKVPSSVAPTNAEIDHYQRLHLLRTDYPRTFVHIESSECYSSWSQHAGTPGFHLNHADDRSARCTSSSSTDLCILIQILHKIPPCSLPSLRKKTLGMGTIPCVMVCLDTLSLSPC